MERLRRRLPHSILISEAALKADLDPGNSADRYQVVVHVDEQVLEDPEKSGQSALEGGIGVSVETSRRIACDASIVEMKHDDKGNVLDVGRKTRTKRPRLLLGEINRAFWVALRTSWPGWASRLVIVHRDTVARWNRDRFRRHWTRISRKRYSGRPRIHAEIRHHIRTMSQDGWGEAPSVPNSGQRHRC